MNREISYIFKKASTILVSFLVLILVGLSVVSCSSAAASDIGSSWVFNSHRIVQESIATPGGRNNIATSNLDFLTPNTYSLAYSNDMRSFQLAGALSPLRVVSPFEDETILDSTNGQVIAVKASSKTRSSRNRFEMIKAVKLISEGGTEFIFDQDYSFNDAESNNPRDINSANFLETLNSTVSGLRIKSISFVLRDELSRAFWRQNFSNNPGPKFSPLDLYTGVLWSFFATPLSRETSYLFGDNNSHKKMQTLINNALVSAKVSDFPKFLQPPLLGDRLSVWDEWSLQTSLGLKTDFASLLHSGYMSYQVGDSHDKDQIFSFSFNAEANSGYKRDFWRYFQTAQLNAMPFFVFQSLKSKYDSTFLQIARSILSSDEVSKLLESIFYKLGFFHLLLADKSEFYWGGKYYISEVSDRALVAKANYDYIDPRYFAQVNSQGQKTTIDEYRYKFVALDNRLGQLAEFRQGTNIKSDYALLSVSEKIAASGADFAKYGVKFGVPYEATVTPFSDYTNLNVLPLVLSKSSGYYFNDNFSKLLYGATASDLSTSNYLPHLLAGDGLRFRKLLNASYNAYAFAQQYTRNNRYSLGDRINWSLPYAPEAVIGSKTTYEAINDPNEISYILQNKFVVSSIDKSLAFTAINDSYYRDAFLKEIGYARMGLSSEESSLLKPSPFLYLKNLFKDLLDKNLGPSLDNKVVWEMPYGLGAQYTTVDAQQIYNNYKYFLKLIDPRLDVVAIMQPSQILNGAYTPARTLIDSWPETTNFRVISKQYDVADAFFHYEDRTPQFNPAAGTNFASAFGGTIYEPDSGSLLPFFYNYDDFRRGSLIVHSFFSDPNNNHLLIGSELAPLAPLFNLIEISFANYISVADAKTLDLRSDARGELILKIKALKFSNLWKTQAYNLLSQGLIGLVNLNEITNIVDRDKLLANDLSSVNAFLQFFMTKIILEVTKDYVHSLDGNALVALMSALQIIAPENFNPLTSTIVNRSSFVHRVEKTWFYSANPTSDNVPIDISRHRVDLDYSRTLTNYQALFQSNDGVFRPAISGGIIF